MDSDIEMAFVVSIVVLGGVVVVVEAAEIEAVAALVGFLVWGSRKILEVTGQGIVEVGFDVLVVEVVEHLGPGEAGVAVGE